jgi:hypothetical protein
MEVCTKVDLLEQVGNSSELGGTLVDDYETKFVDTMGAFPREIKDWTTELVLA